MRLSQIPLQTLREDPADAEVPSHRLLARAGFIQKIAAGIYVYSPLMWRSIQKLNDIIRRELQKEGAHETLLPILQPRELWEQSGRWSRYIADGIMFNLKDKKGTDLCLGPTHEEVITHYIAQTVKSYKQLPINLFQIQDKFRDEIRPRFGLMRGREFIMKDAYSFDVDVKASTESYNKMAKAYSAIFEACGLRFRAVDADSGAIGGSASQEYMVLADTGEDAIMVCSCGYAANLEKAESISTPAAEAGEVQELSKESTPNVRTVGELEEFFKLPASRMAKTVLYKASFEDKEEIVAVMMRGDLDINEVKLTNALGALALELADEESVKRVTGAEVGFAGPIGLQEGTRVLADFTLKKAKNLLVGCCETDYHCLNVNTERDFPKPSYHDLRSAKVGETCKKCGENTLESTRGIEVGHIFQLGDVYSKKMNATFMDKDGKSKAFVMGCYGIGVSRTIASAIEQGFDDRGIVWPRPLAPFEVVVAVLDHKKKEQKELAEKLYAELSEAGYDVCFDDRPMSPGAKFKDLDLIGFPLRVVVGRKAKEGIVEYSIRSEDSKEEIPADSVLAKLKS